jgi:hypothetical protein
VTDPATKTRRALRASAWATIAFALLSAWALPMPLRRGEGGAWVIEAATVLQLAVVIAAAVLLWRGNRVAGALVGLYGAWRIGGVLAALVAIPTGRAPGGPAWLLSQLVIVPFAVFWIRGGLAVLREWRTRGPREAA